MCSYSNFALKSTVSLIFKIVTVYTIQNLPFHIVILRLRTSSWTIFRKNLNQVWCLSPVSPALGRWRREDSWELRTG